MDDGGSELQITEDGYFGSTGYGEMHQYEVGQTVTINTQNAWEEVGGFTYDAAKGITFASDALTVSKPGHYMVFYNVSANPAASGKDLEFGISVNGTISTKTASQHHHATTNPESQSGNGILKLGENDSLKLEVRNRTDTENVSISKANISVMQII
jgi:hypothetical protein